MNVEHIESVLNRVFLNLSLGTRHLPGPVTGLVAVRHEYQERFAVQALSDQLSQRFNGRAGKGCRTRRRNALQGRAHVGHECCVQRLQCDVGRTGDGTIIHKIIIRQIRRGEEGQAGADVRFRRQIRQRAFQCIRSDYPFGLAARQAVRRVGLADGDLIRGRVDVRETR